MIENLIQNLIAISLGAMLFFSFVIAPVIFKVLDAKNAGKFVRKIFPHYYLINLIFSSFSYSILKSSTLGFSRLRILNLRVPGLGP